MKILFHMPSLYTLNTGRTVYNGYKNAFRDLKHEFRVLTSDDNQKDVFEKFNPQIFMAGISPLNIKYLNLDLLKTQKKNGMKVFVNTPFWNSPFSKTRFNEGLNLSKNQKLIKLIKSGSIGDIYYSACEQGDPRMKGFEEATSYKLHTILLAADKTLANTKYNKKFQSDITFIGSYLHGRREFMNNYILPLKKKYNFKLYCQDLYFFDRVLNLIMKTGQYFNIPYIRSFKKNDVTFKEEQQIIRSANICLNIHEDYQKKFGRDFNDRTFKIPLFGGFEITDNITSIKKYLIDGKEIIIANNGKDMLEKIDYFLKNPEKKVPIIEAGRKKVLAAHTYHHRVNQIIDLYKKLKR